MDKIPEFNDTTDIEYFENIFNQIGCKNINKRERKQRNYMKITPSEFEKSKTEIFIDEYNEIIHDAKEKLILHMKNWEEDKTKFPQQGHCYQTLIWKYEIYETNYSKILSFKLYQGLYSIDGLDILKDCGYESVTKFEDARYSLSGFYEIKDHCDGDYECRVHPTDDSEWWDTEMIEIMKSFQEVNPIMLNIIEKFERVV